MTRDLENDSIRNSVGIYRVRFRFCQNIPSTGIVKITLPSGYFQQIENYCTVIQGLSGIKNKLASTLTCILVSNTFEIQNFKEVQKFSLIEVAFKAKTINANVLDSFINI